MPPNDALLKLLSSLHDDAKMVIEQSVTSHQDSLGKVFQLDKDIRTWESRLDDRPEALQIREARRGLAFAIYAAASGKYSHAFAGVRTFMELSFAAVYFSVHELSRRKWMSGRKDFSWAEATDSASGVLSPDFVREFNDLAATEAISYSNQATECYRHCSEFIHGKYAVTQTLPDTLIYSADALADWQKTATTAAGVVLFLIYSRYGADLSAGEDGQLAATLEHSFGHLVSVRTMLGLPV